MLAVMFAAPVLAQPELAAPVSAQPMPEHLLSLYLSPAAVAYLSVGRTQVGLGGRVGIRDVFRDRFVFQADAGYLQYVGRFASLRLGAGIQRQGTWTPMVGVSLLALLGEQLRFSTAAHPDLASGPILAAGLTVQPLRFGAGAVTLSLLEVGAALAPDAPGVGWAFSVGFGEVSVAF